MTEESPTAVLRKIVSSALAEDIGSGDWTSIWTIPESARSEAVIVAKEPLVLAGLDAAFAVFGAIDDALEFEALASDGDRVGTEEEVMRVRGRTRSILTAERTALNFLGRLSGIATYTRLFVDRIEGTGAAIIDTRKTSPGLRVLEKAAVRAGGGINHRMGLHDMVLIKDNHIVACGGIRNAVDAVRGQNTRDLLVEVEVGDLNDLSEALEAGSEARVDRILLDNMSVEQLSEAVASVARFPGPRPLLEASGNVVLETVRAIAESGVDLISVGALTHSAPVADLSLRVL